MENTVKTLKNGPGINIDYDNDLDVSLGTLDKVTNNLEQFVEDKFSYNHKRIVDKLLLVFEKGIINQFSFSYVDICKDHLNIESLRKAYVSTINDLILNFTFNILDSHTRALDYDNHLHLLLDGYYYSPKTERLKLVYNFYLGHKNTGVEVVLSYSKKF